ncbi:hypothetical protein ONE63_005025 [Megalurothrips usitatus]|uniref:F-box domain-containing protein n=1 Tax=Megalurothrips usitatus TaxID=439358 RepID=A0AAV7X4W3_9NEOP|nr:hypothetical protein ONE63_005025 [Megalurothrips usitatus]
MEELPDELLLHVLGFLRDGATLLDCVSLVCKRWRRLAFEPSLWERVCVDVPPCYHRSGSAELFEMVSRAARVVLHAPALLQVDLECFSCELWDELDDDVLFGIGPPACAEHADMKLSALLRTGAKVRLRRLRRPTGSAGRRAACQPGAGRRELMARSCKPLPPLLYSKLKVCVLFAIFAQPVCTEALRMRFYQYLYKCASWTISYA